jgi:hypothetical protein
MVGNLIGNLWIDDSALIEIGRSRRRWIFDTRNYAEHLRALLKSTGAARAFSISQKQNKLLQ